MEASQDIAPLQITRPCEIDLSVGKDCKQKTMYLLNPSGAGSFDDISEKKLRPQVCNDDFGVEERRLAYGNDGDGDSAADSRTHKYTNRNV